MRPLSRPVTYIFLLLCVGHLVEGRAEDQQVAQLRTQLEAAKAAEDKPAIIELSRRILAITPNDPQLWQMLAQTQLETEDLDRLEQTLDAWEKAVKRSAPSIEDFRGALAFKRKDYQNAEKHWLAFVGMKPRPSDAATGYDNLANLCAEQARWEDHAAYRTKAIAAKDSAARRVARACAYLRLHKWDAAYADMAKANKMDGSDSDVKEWLPQFEQLQRFLPQIKTLDAQISKSPNNIELLLQRARLFTVAGRPLLALDDAERAFKLQPASMRARIQTALADARAALAIDDKSADAHFEAARDLDRLNRQAEALSHARIATELDPKDPEKWFYLGVLERQRANFPAAIESQTRSIEISESFVALSEREQCERRIGKISEADADLRRIRDLPAKHQ